MQVLIPLLTKIFALTRGLLAVLSVYLESIPDLGLLTLEEAIYKLSGYPATNLKLKDRDSCTDGYYADVVVFDPEQVQDHATFNDPLQFATGMEYVLVNGVMVLEEGEHTNEFPGQFVKGPGYQD